MISCTQNIHELEFSNLNTSLIHNITKKLYIRLKLIHNKFNNNQDESQERLCDTLIYFRVSLYWYQLR